MVAGAVGSEQVVKHLVHLEAMFSAELHRHMSVLIVTPTRLLISHTDENSDDDPRQAAISSVESIGLKAIDAVALTKVVASPESYPGHNSSVIETWLTMNWGTVRKLELQEASCGDPDCTADHGQSGTMFGEDLVVRMSPYADGVESVDRLIEFGTFMQQLTGGREIASVL